VDQQEDGIKHCWQLTCRQNLKWCPMPDKIAGKHFTFHIASAPNQWDSKDSVFWLAQIMYVTCMA